MGSSTESLTSAMTAPGKHRTVIILDWDDTLLASTWLAMNDLRLDNPHVIEAFHRAELQELESRVAKFLERALTLGTVYLVTNAETGWVELSCERFLPAIAQYLPRVRVVSARTKFEESFPNQPNQWKIHAFREELFHALLADGSSELANVISIGDSHHEREALHVVTSEMENTLVKSVKFVERPGMEVLRRQIELIHGCIEYIAQHGGDLDLMLSQSLLFGPDGDMTELESLTASTPLPTLTTPITTPASSIASEEDEDDLMKDIPTLSTSNISTTVVGVVDAEMIEGMILAADGM
jgi:hypothetical protein